MKKITITNLKYLTMTSKTKIFLKPQYKLNSLNYVHQIASHIFRTLFSKDYYAKELNYLCLEMLNF